MSMPLWLDNKRNAHRRAVMCKSAPSPGLVVDLGMLANCKCRIVPVESEASSADGFYCRRLSDGQLLLVVDTRRQRSAATAVASESVDQKAVTP